MSVGLNADGVGGRLERKTNVIDETRRIIVGECVMSIPDGGRGVGVAGSQSADDITDTSCIRILRRQWRRRRRADVNDSSIIVQAFNFIDRSDVTTITVGIIIIIVVVTIVISNGSGHRRWRIRCE